MVFAAATNNLKKLKEIQRILDGLGHEVKTLNQLGVEIEIEENGKTFAENAIIKAKAVAKLTGLASISDDSGLEVDFLQGKPGVYTARFAGEHATDEENIQKLLQEMKTANENQRQARFVSAVCLYLPDDRNIVCIGTCEGTIGYEKIGEGGFGYDPVFMVQGQSYAQMSSQQKDALSHRGKALRQLQEQLKGFEF